MKIRAFEMKDMAELVVLYQKCFSEAPWFEVHDAKDVLRMFRKYVKTDTKPEMVVYVCEQDGRLVGGAIGFHIWHKQEVLKLISAHCEIHFSAHDSVDREPYQEIQGVFYFAELFVDPSVRGQGIGKALIEERLAFARRRGYQKGVVRTSLDQKVIQHLYKDQLGFKEVARQALLAKKLINGVEEELAYTSVIMIGNI